MNRRLTKMALFSRTTKNTKDQKYDGMIEAVRRDGNGEVNVVRFYERRGPTWSDHMLINRDDLVKRIKDGKKFVIGQRLTYMAGTFDVFSRVTLTGNGGREKLVTDKSADPRVELKEAPLF